MTEKKYSEHITNLIINLIIREHVLESFIYILPFMSYYFKHILTFA